METQTVQTYLTNFGMYASCSKEDYKKLKRIRHLLELCRGRNNRFKWYWRKVAHNRCIRNKKSGMVTAVAEPQLFTPFFVKKDIWANIPENARKFCNYQWDDTEAQNRYTIEETQLLRDFLQDHHNAKHPVSKVEDVPAMILTSEQIDSLLGKLEEYIAT